MLSDMLQVTHNWFSDFKFSAPFASAPWWLSKRTKNKGQGRRLSLEHKVDVEVTEKNSCWKIDYVIYSHLV